MKEPQPETFLDGRVCVIVGDLTHQHVDAIVNAANASLLGGGGVDGAIHEAGGPTILEQCREIRRVQYPQGLPVGEAVVTTGGMLPVQFVIHTVGPMYGKHKGRESELLAACYRNSLMLAAKHSLTSIAFPAISTGAYGYPREEAAAVASLAVQEVLTGDDSIQKVLMVFFQPADARIFIKYQKFM